MNPNELLKGFLDGVKSYIETGDNDDAEKACDCHFKLHYYLIAGNNEPDWEKAGTTKAKFYSFTDSGVFTIKVN